MNRRLLLATSLTVTFGMCPAVLGQSPSFRETVESINATIRANHYRRAELDSEAYQRIEKDVIALGERATSAEEFMDGFNALWRKGPFSHVGLRRADELAAVRYARFDTEKAGPGAVTLTWQGAAAILTVTTMSGADTIEAINAAYDEIVSRKAAKLIIDLRRNDGRAFAVVPLVAISSTSRSTPALRRRFVVCRPSERAQEPPSVLPAKPWRRNSVEPPSRPIERTRPLTHYPVRSDGDLPSQGRGLPGSQRPL